MLPFHMEEGRYIGIVRAYTYNGYILYTLIYTCCICSCSKVEKGLCCSINNRVYIAI